MNLDAFREAVASPRMMPALSSMAPPPLMETVTAHGTTNMDNVGPKEASAVSAWQKMRNLMLSYPGMAVLCCIFTFLILLIARPRFVMSTPASPIETPHIVWLRVLITSASSIAAVGLVYVLRTYVKW